MKKITLLLFVMFTMCAGSIHGQLIAIKTNALMDVACAPNIGLEVATGNKTSVAFSGFASWNIYSLPCKTYGCTPEFRYWITGRTFNRLFVGAGATLLHYDADLGSRNYNGSTYGVGINVGYAMWLGKHFSVEFHGGVAAHYYTDNRTPLNTTSQVAQPASQSMPVVTSYSEHGWTALPYQLGITFVYVIR